MILHPLGRARARATARVGAQCMGFFSRRFGFGRKLLRNKKPKGTAERMASPAEQQDSDSGKRVFMTIPGHPDYAERPSESDLNLPPDSLYTLALLGPTIFRWKDIKGTAAWLQVWKLFQRCYLLHIYSLTVQVFIMYELWAWAAKALDPESSPCGSDPLLRFACLSIYTIAITADMHESWAMLNWMIGVQERGFAKQVVEVREDEDEKMHDSYKLTLWHYIVSIVFVLVPKIVISIVLWIIGIGFIALAETNEDMIIDMLAITFVLEIDELIFASCTTVAMHAALERLPPVPKLTDKEKLKIKNEAKIAPHDDGDNKVSALSALSERDGSGTVKAVVEGARRGSDVVTDASVAAATATKKITQEFVLTPYKAAWQTFYMFGFDKVVTIALISFLAYGSNEYVCGPYDSPTKTNVTDFGSGFLF